MFPKLISWWCMSHLESPWLPPRRHRWLLEGAVEAELVLEWLSISDLGNPNCSSLRMAPVTSGWALKITGIWDGQACRGEGCWEGKDVVRHRLPAHLYQVKLGWDPCLSCFHSCSVYCQEVDGGCRGGTIVQPRISVFSHTLGPKAMESSPLFVFAVIQSLDNS